jgi:hypothetical protein
VHTVESSNKGELTNYVQERRPPSGVHRTPRTNDTKVAAAPSPFKNQVQKVKSQDLVEVSQSKSGEQYVDPEPASTQHTAVESVPVGSREDKDQQMTGAPIAPELSDRQHDEAEETQHSSSDGDDDDDEDDGSTAIEVTVPDGSAAGDTISLELPDGTELEVSIPSGCQAGDVFDVEIAAVQGESEHSDDSLASSNEETLNSHAVAQTSPHESLSGLGIASPDKAPDDPFSELASMLGGL